MNYRMKTVLSSACFFLSVSHTSATTCSDKVKTQLLEKKSGIVKLSCSLQLKPSEVVTKRIIIEGKEGSGVVIDCQGGRLGGGLNVFSKKVGGQWSRPENVTVRRCHIGDVVRIAGMAKNGEGADLRDSSYHKDHTLRAQNNAPKNVLFDRVKIEGHAGIPLYISPGVTYFKLINSEVTGSSTSVGVYLDTESAYNTIKNSSIHVRTDSREQLAVDASAHNLIVGNRFAELRNGGIYMYRNCGEGGTIRHQTPSYNQIINNTFVYKKSNTSKPAIHVASRNGNRKYCNDDAGYPFGSSVSNLDFAQNNVLAQNQIMKFAPQTKIYVDSSPNLLIANERVPSQIKRKSGCYMKDGYPSDFLNDGQVITEVMSKGEIICKGKSYKCVDGEIISQAYVCPPRPLTVTKIVECQVSANNNGCEKQFSCPAGKRVSEIKGVCNLEYGKVSDSQLSQMKRNTLTVVRSSDYVDQGSCRIEASNISAGSVGLNMVLGLSSVKVGCREHDKTGGDCHVKAIVTCR